MNYSDFLDRKTQAGNSHGFGAELKPSYYKQAVRNLADAVNHVEQELIPA